MLRLEAHLAQSNAVFCNSTLRRQIGSTASSRHPDRVPPQCPSSRQLAANKFGDFCRMFMGCVRSAAPTLQWHPCPLRGPSENQSASAHSQKHSSGMQGLSRIHLRILETGAFTLVAGHAPGIPQTAKGHILNFSARLLTHRCNSSILCCGLPALSRTFRVPHRRSGSQFLCFDLLGFHALLACHCAT